MSIPAADTVLVERDGHVLVVTMNRPEARNAVNGALTLGVGTAFEEAEQDGEIRAVVLTGAGDLSFCAGADLKALSRGESLSPPGTEVWGFARVVVPAEMREEYSAQGSAQATARYSNFRKFTVTIEDVTATLPPGAPEP